MRCRSKAGKKHMTSSAVTPVAKIRRLSRSRLSAPACPLRLDYEEWPAYAQRFAERPASGRKRSLCRTPLAAPPDVAGRLGQSGARPHPRLPGRHRRRPPIPGQPEHDRTGHAAGHVHPRDQAGLGRVDAGSATRKSQAHSRTRHTPRCGQDDPPSSSPRSISSSTCRRANSTPAAVLGNGPSSSRPARPCTADHAAISAPSL